MKEIIKKAVETYQCPGCVTGSNISCYESVYKVECENHVAGTTIQPYVGRIFLGMPKGFNRLGPDDEYKIYILETLASCEWYKTKFNIPVWKYLDRQGNTLVRGISPRLNKGWIHIFLEDCRDKINCIEITNKDIEEMD